MFTKIHKLCTLCIITLASNYLTMNLLKQKTQRHYPHTKFTNIAASSLFTKSSTTTWLRVATLATLQWSWIQNTKIMHHVDFTRLFVLKHYSENFLLWIHPGKNQKASIVRTPRRSCVYSLIDIHLYKPRYHWLWLLYSLVKVISPSCRLPFYLLKHLQQGGNVLPQPRWLPASVSFACC